MDWFVNGNLHTNSTYMRFQKGTKSCYTLAQHMFHPFFQNKWSGAIPAKAQTLAFWVRIFLMALISTADQDGKSWKMGRKERDEAAKL